MKRERKRIIWNKIKKKGRIKKERSDHKHERNRSKEERERKK